MEQSLSFSDTEAFYSQLQTLEAANQDYVIDTGIMEVKSLPLRLIHHIGITKEEIGHVQHKVVFAVSPTTGKRLAYRIVLARRFRLGTFPDTVQQ